MDPLPILILALTGGAAYLAWSTWDNQRRLRDRGHQRIIGMVNARRRREEEVLSSANDPRLALARREGEFRERVRKELWRAGMSQLPPERFLMIAGGMVAGLTLVGLIFTRNPFALLFAAGLGAGAPYLALRMAQNQRRGQIEAQLAEALNLSSSTLRSGYSLLQAMQVICEEMPAPISEEFALVLDEMKIGLTLEAALIRMGERVKSRDVDLLVTASSIQYRLGGNLSEILDTIGESIRERFQFRSEVSALTAEARLSGMVLFLLPISILLVLLKFNPDYIRPLFTEPMGQNMLGLAILMQGIGGIIIRKMINIDY